jgi:hypothetical protein
MTMLPSNHALQRTAAGRHGCDWRARGRAWIVSRLRNMRVIAVILFLTATQFCFASGDTNIIARSDWSKPVGTEGGHSLRARMIVAYGWSAAFVGPWPETQFYLEFQNVSGAIVSPTQFYFNPSKGLRCELKDVSGMTVSTGGGGSGGGAGASWITLPYDSTIRLRANMYGYGSKPGEGLNLTLYPPQAWQIKAGDTNVYYLSGTFTVTTPTNFVPKDFEAARAVWSGTLELPKMKITVPKP